MGKLRRTIASLSVVAVLSSLFVVNTASAGVFTDVPDSHWFAQYVQSLVDAKVIDGTKKTFEPEKVVNRAELVKMVTVGAGTSVEGLPTKSNYSDVATTDWFFTPVHAAEAAGIIKSASKFEPLGTSNRAQAAKVIVEAFGITPVVASKGIFPDVKAGEWYYDYVNTLFCYGIAGGYGDGSFGPAKEVTKAQLGKMISIAMGDLVIGNNASCTAAPEGDDDTGDDDTGDDDTGDDDDDVVVGDIELTMSENSPAADVVPKSATRVPYLAFNVDGTGTITSMSFKRVGSGQTSDFSNVYLYEGDTRLTTGRTINSSTHLVTFTGLDYEVDGMSELWVIADMSSTGNGNQNAFQLEEVVSDDNVTAEDIVGEAMAISNVTVGSVTIEKTGSLTNPKVGETDVKIAEFKVTAGSGEDLMLNGVTLYQVGNVSRSNLTTFVLKQAGNEVASQAEVNSKDNIVLTFDEPMALSKGTDKTFELYANIGASSRANDTIRIYLDNSADLDAVGDTYGFGVSVTRGAYDNGAADGTDASWTTVEGGEITMSFQGPSVADYANDTQDVELLRFTVAAQNESEVRSTGLTLTAGGTDADADDTDNGGLKTMAASANYTDVKLVDVDTGVTLAGPTDVSITGSDATQTFTLTDIWTLEAGETRTLAVKADIANFTPHSTETIKATLESFGASDIKNLDNNQFVATTSIVPTGDMSGNTHFVKAGTITVSGASTPTIQTYINGAQNIDLAGILLQAGPGKDAYLKSLTVTATGATTCATETDCISSLKLVDETGAQVGTSKSLSTTTAAFTNLNFKVGKGQTSKLTVVGNLNTLASVAGGTTLRIDVAATTDYTVQDVKGNSVTKSGTTTGPAHVISSGGTLTIAKASDETDTTEKRIVVAGKQNEVLAKFNLTAASEQLKLTKIRLKVASIAADEVTALSLYDGDTLISGPFPVDNTTGQVDFNTFAADFIVPKDETKALTVKGNLNTTSGGADSGSVFSVSVDLGVDSNFEVRGIGTNTVLDGDHTATDSVNAGTVGADVAANEMTLRKTKFVAESVALGTSALNNGSAQDIYKFSVAADSAGDVGLKQVKLNVTLTDNNANNALTLGTFKLLRNGTDITDQVTISKADGTNIEAANLDEAAGAAQVVVIVFGATTGEETITKGTTNTYTLRATPGDYGTSADDDKVTVELLNDSAVQTTALGASLTPEKVAYLNDADATAGEYVMVLDVLAGTTDEAANIIWSDKSVVGHLATMADNSGGATSSLDWMNSFLIKKFPHGSTSINN